MNNPNLIQHAKMLDRMADNLENEAKRLRESAEALRAANAVVDPVFRAIEVATKESAK